MSPRAFDRYMIELGVGTNKKLRVLTDSEFRAHVAGVLALAAQSPRRGYLLITADVEVTAEDIANEAGGKVTARVAASAVQKLKARGVLIWDEEVRAWYVRDWREHDPRARVRRRILPQRTRQSVIARCGRICGICGQPIGKDEPFHVDHIVPVALGGSDADHNLQPAHPACNLRKGGK